jgi:hypothetical protein
MKTNIERHLKLVKEILEQIDEIVPIKMPYLSLSNLNLPNYDKKEVSFFSRVLFEEGYIKGERANTENIDFLGLTIKGLLLIKTLENQ